MFDPISLSFSITHTHTHTHIERERGGEGQREIECTLAHTGTPIQQHRDNPFILPLTVDHWQTDHTCNENQSPTPAANTQQLSRWSGFTSSFFPAPCDAALRNETADVKPYTVDNCEAPLVLLCQAKILAKG
jgi:hypothetical protein